MLIEFGGLIDLLGFLGLNLVKSKFKSFGHDYPFR
jgi:hypothetical protein